ncbi:MAG: hypothetical protein J5I81_10005 [Nitrococcus mobilis]|nr:hypothetical protein [Nitrococcus mobilis]
MKTQFAIRRHQYVPIAIMALGLLWGTSTWAASSATQTATFEVTAINEISVSGNPGTLTINSATAGSAPDAASDSSTTYAVTTNETNKKITTAIDTAMPSGVTLTVDMTAPTGATSAGAVTLDTVEVDAVTGISSIDEQALGITYQLSATADAGVVAQTSRTVTFTVTDGGP